MRQGVKRKHIRREIIKYMHFTVLTAVTLPENCGQAINLPATVRINELVAALRRARFGDNAAKDALDSELVETQVRFEQMVEDLVDNRLLPYCENIEDRAYLEFGGCRCMTTKFTIHTRYMKERFISEILALCTTASGQNGQNR